MPTSFEAERDDLNDWLGMADRSISDSSFHGKPNFTIHGQLPSLITR